MAEIWPACRICRSNRLLLRLAGKTYRLRPSGTTFVITDLEETTLS